MKNPHNITNNPDIEKKRVFKNQIATSQGGKINQIFGGKDNGKLIQ